MKLHIDIETYSSVELKDCGLYKYIESPDFEILLIAYAIDQGEVQIVDLARGEELPGEFIAAFKSVDTELHAHNAAFERIALGKYFHGKGAKLSPLNWHCSMVKAAYCGLPLSLEQVSAALNMGDKGKLDSGKDLIRYFCKPCKPTKTNEGRTRNLPHHDPEKWEAFKEYCKRDVEAERFIDNRLRNYKIPEFERENYIIDQIINDRGIKVDLPMVEAIVAVDKGYSEELMEKAKALTGLDNPNSPAQLKKWLSNALAKEVKSLAKDSIPALMEKTDNRAVLDVLDLRTKMSRSSIKKYTKMLDSTCSDGRAHGLFQFYGANRTGRWAGRLIQLQNLVQNHLGNLSVVRELAASGDRDTLELMYEDLASVLAQLVRTAFVARDNHTFIVADFSAIEARVIAWLAGETWRLDVFNSHGKIYEASAAMMFNVPIDKITKGSDLRAKGKIAELALGYQGSVGAMKQMAGPDTDLTEEDMKGIVDKWRRANPKIARFWKDVENAAKRAVQNSPCELQHGLKFNRDADYLVITLPSGRQLFYREPSFTTNQFDQPCIQYKGMIQETRKWGNVPTYGGKLTENIVQAVARDLLAHAITLLEDSGYEVVMHVHDEVVCEVNLKLDSDEELEKVCEIMGHGPEWSKGLPLEADGYVTPFYKKD